MDRYKKRLTFEKTGRTRFIGHLDMLRVIQRGMSRGKIDMVFSQGFNPHPQMSFAQPLSLGVTGIREYMEMETMSYWDNDKLMETLNAQLPPGIVFHEAKDMPEGCKTAMATSEYALYYITLPEQYEEQYPQWIEDFMKQDAVMIRKFAKFHGKKREVEFNLRPLLDSFRMIEPHVAELWCVCNIQENTKPDRMMQQFWKFVGHEEEIANEQICRQDLFTVRGGIRVPLMDTI